MRKCNQSEAEKKWLKGMVWKGFDKLSGNKYFGLIKDKESQITLYNVLLTPEGLFHQTHTLNGVIERKQNKAAMLGLDLLRRYLQQKNL